jgi:hypothetical protein
MPGVHGQAQIQKCDKGRYSCQLQGNAGEFTGVATTIDFGLIALLVILIVVVTIVQLGLTRAMAVGWIWTAAARNPGPFC